MLLLMAPSPAWSTSKFRTPRARRRATSTLLARGSIASTCRLSRLNALAIISALVPSLAPASRTHPRVPGVGVRRPPRSAMRRIKDHSLNSIGANRLWLLLIFSQLHVPQEVSARLNRHVKRRTSRQHPYSLPFDMQHEHQSTPLVCGIATLAAACLTCFVIAGTSSGA